MHQKLEIFLQWAVSSNIDSTKTNLNVFWTNQALHLVRNKYCKTLLSVTCVFTC